MKCLVTGGLGFIGRHLVRRLVEDGHEVTILDCRVGGLGAPAGARHLLMPAQAVMPWDLNRIEAEWVFHLAGCSYLVPSISQPRRYHDSNVTGTLAMLEACRGSGLRAFVYAASSSCYGATPPIPVGETAVCEPVHPYALTKWIGERYVLRWGSLYQMPVTSLRLFNVYGSGLEPSESYGPVLGTFLAQRAHGWPLTVVGDGWQCRDFVWVEDVVEAFIRAAAWVSAGRSGSVFNVGSGVSTSVNELAALIGGPIVPLPDRGGEPRMIVADITKITSAMGWRPTVGLEEGMRRVRRDLPRWTAATVWGPEAIAKETAEWHRWLS